MCTIQGRLYGIKRLISYELIEWAYVTFMNSVSSLKIWTLFYEYCAKKMFSVNSNVNASAFPENKVYFSYSSQWEWANDCIDIITIIFEVAKDCFVELEDLFYTRISIKFVLTRLLYVSSFGLKQLGMQWIDYWDGESNPHSCWNTWRAASISSFYRSTLHYILKHSPWICVFLLIEKLVFDRIYIYTDFKT